MSYEKAESLELVGLVSVVGIFSIVAGISSNFFALIVNVCYFQFEVGLAGVQCVLYKCAREQPIKIPTPLRMRNDSYSVFAALLFFLSPFTL